MSSSKNSDKNRQTLLEFLKENNKEVKSWSKEEYILSTLESNYNDNIPVFFNVKKTKEDKSAKEW